MSVLPLPVPLYLASQSPRRRELLAQMGWSAQVLVHDPAHPDDAEVNEDSLPGEQPAPYVLRLAREKALAGVKRMQQRGLPAGWVLAADTTLAVDGGIIGKPVDAADAQAILSRLSGRSHQVLTGVALADAQGRVEVALSHSDVEFAEVDAAEIARYVASGEPMDKAGAYGIQGQAALFIREIRGSYTGIMGLPLFETGELFRRLRATSGGNV